MNDDQFFGPWLNKVYSGVVDTYGKYPFLFYGYDWLAFAHLVIAALFYGIYKDPVRNKFILSLGNVLLLHRYNSTCIYLRKHKRYSKFITYLVDCSFGVIGIIPLYVCRRFVLQLEALQKAKRLTHRSKNFVLYFF
jgi:hypothetical protein